MLSPNSRSVYLEQLAPPDGYRLDRAVATTYSLDLLSLLMAPLSMALHECRDRHEVLTDPVAVLEALRQTSDRFSVFCHESRISVPNLKTQLYSLLEPVVVQARPPGSDGAFHPKVWVLRYVPVEDEPQSIQYRFLCLSRNLTFDRSWDTIVRLDGEVTASSGRISVQPLVRFIEGLERCSTSSLSERIRDDLALLADELSRVEFESPVECNDDVSFHPIGLGQVDPPDLAGHKRKLVLSPFLSDKKATELLAEGHDNVLISRMESLDELQDETLLRLSENTTIYCLDETAERPEDVEGDTAERDMELERTEFSGLHAKLFICENGGQATVFTGSANATTAAFGGDNVEFLVGLPGWRDKLGIESFLGTEDQKYSFLSLLQPYHRGASLPESEKVRRQLERELDRLRNVLATAGPTLHIEPVDKVTCSLALRFSEQHWDMPDGIRVSCHPITVNSDLAVAFHSGNEASATFAELSISALTGFMAFRIDAERSGQKASLAFVLNLPVEGMPADRDSHVLRDIISDRARFVRFLLLILADDNDLGALAFVTAASDAGRQTPSHNDAIPLLEELVRAFSRHPEKIDRVADVVAELRKTDQVDDLFPDGFEEVWDVLMAARAAGGAE
jgi:hypothetical protein